MCLRLRPAAPPLRLRLHSLTARFSLPVKSRAAAATMSTAVPPTVEHVVLFKVKPDADPSSVSAMLSGLSGLTSLPSVLHLSAGPYLCLRSRSPAYAFTDFLRLRSPSRAHIFTHFLHSRHASKDDLASYSHHPAHLAVVRESVLPICDDIMAVDWLAHGLGAPLSPPPGSALRLSFLKLKEGSGSEEKSQVLAAIEGVRDGFGQITQLSVGENFSPARAKGFSIASLAVFPGVSELEAVDSDKEALDSHKDKVRDYLESVIVVDYVVSLPQSASL